MADKNKIELVEALADEAGEEGEILNTANEVNQAEIIKALQEDLAHLEHTNEAIVARINAMNDISRMNVASNVLAHYLLMDANVRDAIEHAWDTAEDFVQVFEDALEKRQQEMIGLLKEQDNTGGGETIQ